MPHLIMGLLARAGSAPFVFEEPLPYADLIVGLAVARSARKDGDHLTAMARLYSNRGVVLGWRAARAVVPAGTGLTPDMLAHLLPGKQIANKRILIHCDGRLRQADASALVAWEEAHDAAIYPLEIMAYGAPRLYSFADKRIDIPGRGSAFILNAREALLATASAPYNATPQPLHVRLLAPLKLEQALDSIMAMTLLHHGNLRLPKLPVTLAHAEDFAQAVERGVFPDADQGERAWWL
jgi:hypothetical protein